MSSDAIVRDNMMTISVAPVAQLQEDGKLRVNVQNVKTINFPSDSASSKRRDHVRIRCGRDRQDNRDVPRRRHQKGEAYIEIQALDAKTLDSHGNPTRVKVRVEQSRELAFWPTRHRMHFTSIRPIIAGRPAANRKERPWTSPGT